MKTMKLFYLSAVVCTLVFSCGTPEDRTSDKEDVNADTLMDIATEDAEVSVLPEIVFDINVLLNKTNKLHQLPFLLDSVVVESMDKEAWKKASTLTTQEVQYLSANFLENSLTISGSNSIRSFLEIDSLKRTGRYEEYTENIEIGMIQFAEANIGDKIQINDNSFILLWAVYYSSFEACPFSAGTVIFGTLFVNNEASNTTVLGETSGGGDAPYWSDAFITSEITAFEISIHKVDRYGGEYEEETDEEIVDVSNETFSINITDTGFIVEEQ